MAYTLNGFKFELEHCCKCGIPYLVTDDFRRRRGRDSKDFYCPNGHPQHYGGKSDEQLLREEKNKSQRLLNRNASLSGENVKLAKSVHGYKGTLGREIKQRQNLEKRLKKEKEKKHV